MAGVTLGGICKSFGTQQVLFDISLEIGDGEFVAFVGPSGCGKSTLLRVIAGLEAADGGEVRFGGRVMNAVPAPDRGAAMVFQSYALYPHMTVWENMSFSLRLQGVGRAERRRRAAEVAATLQLGPYLDRRPAQLSGGQRQRVAIGRALLRQPEIFLFDEPLSNLDAALRAEMRVELARLHQTLGKTMIYVTHDQTEAMTLAGRIFVMREGRIEQFGRPLELYDDPVNQFVAGFVGSPRMNFLPATVAAAEAGRVRIAIEGHPEATPELTVAAPAAEGQPVLLGVRPEHFLPAGSGAGDLAFHVDVVERLGGTSYAHAALGPGGGQVIIALGDEKGRSLQARDRLHVAVPPDRALLFDAQGQRLR